MTKPAEEEIPENRRLTRTRQKAKEIESKTEESSEPIEENRRLTRTTRKNQDSTTEEDDSSKSDPKKATMVESKVCIFYHYKKYNFKKENFQIFVVLNLLNKGHSFQRTSLKFQRFFCCPLFLSLRYRKNLTSCPLFFKNYILPLVLRLIFFNENQILKIIHFAFSSKVDLL